MASLVAACACATPALATKAHRFDLAFGAGELQSPQGIALNETSGNVYVVNPGGPQINEYSESGTPLSEFDGAAAPTGALEAPKDIAVDNSKNPLDPSEGDVYVSGEVKVAGEAVHVIYKFSEGGTYLGQITSGSAGAPFGELFGVALDPAGQLWVYQKAASGIFGEVIHYTNALENEPAGSCEALLFAQPGLAVDAEDNLYVNTIEEFAKLNSSCEQLIPALGKGDASEPGSAASVDGENNQVYVDEFTSVAHFTSEAELINRFGKEETPAEGDLQEGAGIAVNAASAKKLVYVADRGANEVKVYEEVIRPTVITLPATGLGPEKATLNATVNPEGVLVSSCVFQYGESTAYGQSVPCQPPPGEGEAPVAVSAKPAGLQVGKTYHYRVLAANANGSSAGEDRSFTLGPGLEAASVSDVSADAATFSARIDPHHVATGAFFQYGPTTAYGSNVPASPIALGEGEGPVEVGPEHVQGLSASSTYHYRVVAVQEGRQFPGPDQSFTTQGGGGPLELPDGRAWELVSPAEKRSGVIEALTEPGGAVQAATQGGAFSYLANAPTEASPQGSAGLIQVLSTHGSSGWSSKDIANPHSRATGKNLNPPEYTLFSEDLSAGLIQPWGIFEPSLSEAASEQTPYIRTLGACSSNCYEPLLSAKAGHQNALAGFGEEQPCGEENGEAAQVLCGPRFLGATRDLAHVVLVSPAPLSEGAGREQLYEWSGGALSQVSLLPKNEAGEELPAPENVALHEGEARFGVGLGVNGHSEGVGSVKHAISADGRRVFWEVATPTQNTLYVRDSERGETLELDKAEAACVTETRCKDGGGRFQVASADGKRVLFTDRRRLSKGGSPEGDLYECELAIEGGKLACELTDLTPEAGGEAVVQRSVLGASEDLSTVYFVGLGALDTAPNARGQSPLEGQPNLYVRRGGAVSFIATLAEGDRTNWEGLDEAQPARVSSDGRRLAFMSEAPLTGYDNRDALSAERDAEVYEYDAQGKGLSCLSCDPSGARPRGVEFDQIIRSDRERLVGGQAGEWLGSGWVAALLPGSPSFTVAESAYQSRSLSDSGRVFFNELDPLVPQDVNGNWDVYEREPVGVGGCKAGAVGFESDSESCLGMISSGSSARQSAFLDASESGADVFFITSEKLTSKDIDESRDIYDAHECAVGWSCPPEEAVLSPPCSTEASCRAAPSPQPQIFGAPASASFSGPGNPPPPPPVKPKPPTRHELLLKALASCHKRFAHAKAKRSSCERQARRRYGTVAKKKSAKKASKGAKAKQGTRGGHR